MEAPGAGGAGDDRAEIAAALAESCRADDLPGFLARLEALLKQGGFAKARQDLLLAASRSGGDFGHFALRCLASCANKQHAQAAALLAELGPGPAVEKEKQSQDSRPCLGAVGEEVVRQLAATSLGLKLAQKVLQSWGLEELESLQAETRGALTRGVLREARGGAPAAAAAALAAWPSLLDAQAQCEVLDAVDDGNRDDVAVKLAGSLSRECQLRFVRRRQGLKRLKAAARGAEALGLREDFPDADFAWRSQALASCLEHGKREAAVGLSFEEPRLHEACVLGLLAGGDAELAVELGAAWGVALPPEAEAAAEEARQRQRIQSLCLPEGLQVLVVGSEADLPAMQAALLAAPAVGLDSESSMEQGGPPCLLQLSTHAAAYLVDLQALGASRALAEALEVVLSSAAVAKVGFDARADLRHIARGIGGCSNVANLVDVRDLAASAISRDAGVSLKRAQEGLSLAGLAERYLGRPLNKAMRVSDWRRRPMSPAQMHYAALDAWVPLQVFQHLTSG